MGAPLKVLVADDHPMNRAVLEIILGTVEADLVAVEDGAQAVEVFKSQNFDVVLMDLQMPVMNGLTATEEIRKFEAAEGRPRTPVLAVTACARSDHVVASRAAGCDLHIAKPVVPSALLKAVAEQVAAAQAWRQPPARANA